MPKRFFKKYMPSHAQVKEHKYLKAFGTLLHNPNLWHLNRYSASGGVAVGLFASMIPLPLQMILAAIGAIVFRVNLPLAIGMTWLTNPLTAPPLYYLAYKIGAWIMRVPTQEFQFELSFDWLSQGLEIILEPFLLGSVIMGAVSALLGYWLVRWLWRLMVIKNWAARKVRRQRASPDQQT
ncbi:MAG: hypothetical protein A2V90_09190 [Gammaproteobacteria bacterium RBG_16_57_12]|nr:MAG: hypothetical protein A2V90_09190 [Gammaproteobacteria bacterium RBG_16_57_12]